MSSNQYSANYEKLKKELQKVFQLDQADLDFGIYRIMNQKRNEINDFLDNQLLPQVKAILNANDNGNNLKTKQDLEKAIEQAAALGLDPESLPKVQELKNKLSISTSVETLEEEVYSNLANFFKRYYKDGDFLSLRRYKKDVYAIPYEGEEVKLHWANNDQYYIKTSEYLKNYGFQLPNGKSVKFELKEASTEQNNNKEQSGKERRFQLYKELPISISENGKVLIINFIYEELDKKFSQDKINNESLETLAHIIPNEFISILEKRPTDKNKDRTLLEKHIIDFTARNSFDYFIHKDLEGFLNRELDFYIKNEILYLDDINTENENNFVAQLSKVRAIKQVGQKIITFLAQLENFQKKLWLKKKFVISTNYCISIDRIPEKYFEEIIKNNAQLIEWKELFKIHEIKGDLLSVNYTEPLSIEFLKNQPFLILDTKFFSLEFKEKLIGEIYDLDKQLSGLMINTENFQGLNLLLNKYSNKISFVYADPPYNAKSSEILYKNTFKHSSWLSLMNDRIKLASILKSSDGSLVTAIDENEITNLKQLFHTNFPYWEHDSISIVHNPAGVQGDNFSYSHEYAIYSYQKQKGIIGKTNRAEDSEEAFRDWGGTSSRLLAKNCFYPIITKNDEIIGFGDVCEDNFHPNDSNIINGDEIYVYPVADDGEERKWVFARHTVESIKHELRVKNKNGKISISRNKSMTSYKTVWSGNQYYANIYGSKLLNNILGDKKFDFPKSIHTVEECANAIESFRNKESITIDYFAGSGTTGHAVTNFNRLDGGKRKFILLEMGRYFDAVTKPRNLKVAYSSLWKDGYPQDNNGVSSFFKYHDLESYEDVLNNLSFTSNKTQIDLLQNSDFKEEFMLNYIFDFESKDSLLNIDAFKNPFNYKLNITRNNESQETVVDLVETFNYLIGLHIKTMQTIRGFKVITGITNERKEEILIIWRNLEEKNNKELNDFFSKMEFSTKDTEFQRIYVNGDNHLENLKTGDDNWKVVLIEEEFMKLMFTVQDV